MLAPAPAEEARARPAAPGLPRRRPAARADLDAGGSPGSELPVLDPGRSSRRDRRELGVDHAIIAFSRASHEGAPGVARRLLRLGVTRLRRAAAVRGDARARRHGAHWWPAAGQHRPVEPARLAVLASSTRSTGVVAALALLVLLAGVSPSRSPSASRRAARSSTASPASAWTGATFEMLKFRTMRTRESGAEADAEGRRAARARRSAPRRPRAHDRRTPVGALPAPLRRSTSCRSC